jgi:AraC-like DNA-binding protein
MQQIESITQIALRHCNQQSMFQTAIPSVSLFYSPVPTDPLPTFYDPSVCLITQGNKQVRFGETDFQYGAGDYLVAGFDVPIIGTVTNASPDKPYVCVKVNIDRARLGNIVVDALPPNNIPPFYIAQAQDELLEVFMRLLRLLDTPEDVASFAPLYELEILHRLLRGPQGNLLRQFALSSGRTAQISRAIAYISTHYKIPFDIDMLLSTSGMSQSAFYREFRATTGINPIQYRTRLRLQEVRRLMLVENMTAENAGYNVGYDSPSQLSREYKKLYGSSPKKDIEQLRTYAIAHGKAGLNHSTSMLL